MKDYKKIIEGVVNIISTTKKSDIGFANICTYIGEKCPELAESEDERIRKAIKYCIKQGFIGHGRIENVIVDDCLAWLEKQGEQNTAWSEEDEKRLQSCLNVLQPRGIMGVTETINTKWLKSLKNRVQPKQEWSSKEDAFVQVCINAINGISYFSSEQKEIVIDWLKSIRPQKQ